MWRKQTETRLPPSSEPEPPRLANSPPAAAPLPQGQARESHPDSRIAPSLRIRGELSGESALLVEGSVEGPVRLRNADLTVGPKGMVRGNLEAREVHIQGEVAGDVTASSRIVLLTSCVVTGHLMAPRIVIEDGARFVGRVDMEKTAAVSAPRRAEDISSEPASVLYPTIHMPIEEA